MSEEALQFDGAYNFRDIGGKSTTDGRRVRTGSLFRADELSGLSVADLERLERLRITTVVDFRGVAEKEGAGLLPAAPNRLPERVARAVELPIEAGAIFSADILQGVMAGSVTEAELANLMMETYRQLVSQDDYLTQLRAFFALLQHNDAPLVYHCSAGKDRTGVVTMLILSALGVARNAIVEDYMLSNRLLAGKYDRYVQMFPVIRPLVTVAPEYLGAAYQQIEATHNSIENFLVEILAVDLHRMRESYTSPL